MNRIVVEQRVGNDGILHLILPMGVDEAGQEMRVTVEPLHGHREPTVEAWQAAILATAGGWRGEFERQCEGELEQREPLS